MEALNQCQELPGPFTIEKKTPSHYSTLQSLAITLVDLFMSHKCTSVCEKHGEG